MQNYYELLQLLNIHNQYWPNLSKFQVQTIGTLKRRMDHKFVAFSTSKHRRLPLEQLKKTIWHQFQRSMNNESSSDARKILSSSICPQEPNDRALTQNQVTSCYAFLIPKKQILPPKHPILKLLAMNPREASLHK